MFKRAYVEITNLCNLRCSFCPGTRRPPGRMSPERFRLAARALRGHTRYVYLHVMGEPLLHPELGEILDICAGEDLRACVTTNGTLLPRAGAALLHPAVHKVSISLHSAEGSGAGDLEAYLEGVWAFCRLAEGAGKLCALRLWNIGGADRWNGEILSFLGERTMTAPLAWPQPRPDSWRLGERLYLERAERFDWPDLNAPERGASFCLALREQIAILWDGTVVPCCLDHEGDIPLGNLFFQSLEEILASPRARALYDGFSARRPREALCRRCGYAERFG